MFTRISGEARPIVGFQSRKTSQESLSCCGAVLAFVLRRCLPRVPTSETSPYRDCLDKMLLLLGLRACTPAEVARCRSSYSFSAWCLMVRWHPRQVQLVLIDPSATLVEPFLGMASLSIPASHARHSTPVVKPCAQASLFQCVCSSLLHSSCIGTLIPSLYSSRIRAMVPLLLWISSS